MGDVIDAQALRGYIEAACGKAGREVVVSVSQLDVLPGRGDEGRSSAMTVAGKPTTPPPQFSFFFPFPVLPLRL